jgi:hypothetical protein
MNKTAIVLALCVTAALAESNFNAPLLGIARDARQQLRLVHGVSGNFVLRQAIGHQVRDWAFAGFGGLVKTRTELLFLDVNAAVVRRRSIPDSDVAMSPGAMPLAALYFLRAENELWASGAVADRKVPIAPETIAGIVVALGPSGRNQAVLAVCRGDSLRLLTVNLRTGNVTAERAPGGSIGEKACSANPAALLMIGSRLVLATANAVVIQTDDGGERRIPFLAAGGAKPELHRAGERWIQLEIAGSPSLIIGVDGTDDKCYRLPGVGQDR